MGAVGAAFELRVELRTHKPGVLRKLHNLHQPSVRRQAGQHHPLLLHLTAAVVLKLKPMAVPLGDFRRPIQRAAACVFRQHTGIFSKTHSPALICDVHLIRH